MLDHAISAFDDLREHIGEPNQRVLDKQLDHLDRHCRDFIARSPIALLATADAGGRCDCSPRGGPPGFARVLDERQLAIPDYTGTAARTRTSTCSRTRTTACSSCSPGWARRYGSTGAAR
jgi:predicted pyridoxine 5'-phosphate oxidase superfamily flavin-nucleotide-binding protein